MKNSKFGLVTLALMGAIIVGFLCASFVAPKTATDPTNFGQVGSLTQFARMSIATTTTLSPATTTLVLPLNGGRVIAILQNDSANTASTTYCRFGAKTVPTTTAFSYRINGAGDKLVINADLFWTGDVSCYAGSGGATLLVTEGVER